MSQQGALHLLESQIAELRKLVAELTERIKTVESAATAGKTKRDVQTGDATKGA